MPRFVGPFEVIKVKSEGLSYDLKSFDSARTFTRAASDLKPYNPRDPSKYPSHLAPQDSSDSETSLEDQQSPFDDIFEPPRGSPDDPGPIGQNPENRKNGPRSNRSHFAPGDVRTVPDSAFERSQNQVSGAKNSESGGASGKMVTLFTQKVALFQGQKFFAKIGLSLSHGTVHGTFAGLRVLHTVGYLCLYFRPKTRHLAVMVSQKRRKNPKIVKNFLTRATVRTLRAVPMARTLLPLEILIPQALQITLLQGMQPELSPRRFTALGRSGLRTPDFRHF